MEIELESLDKKGVFHGHIFIGKNRENYATKLLEAGLAVTYNPVPNKY